MRCLAHASLLVVLLSISALPTTPAWAESDALPDAIVVTATRIHERSLELPVSISSLSKAALREGELRINLSETLVEVPGVSAQSRQNYAQDLQLSIRGFGARSSFGTRGIRLYADGIPGTMPDGQGQFSQFDLGSASRIEVLRGPFSALYGNASGGVISIFTEDGPTGLAVEGTAEAGSLGLQRYSLKGAGDSGRFNYVIDAAHFETNGYRDHSAAERNTGNSKLRMSVGDNTTLTLIGNVIETPAVQDPLGLTSAQLAINPTLAGNNALLYNTRKSLSQEQAGAILDGILGDAEHYTVTVYDGARHTEQFQAILKSSEALATHPGGVVDLNRNFYGMDAHLTDARTLWNGPLWVTAGASLDTLAEDRRGFLNFSGNTLGVLGALRSHTDNHASDLDPYLQAEWRPTDRWHAFAGVRHNEVTITSLDEVRIGIPQSTLHYRATTPVGGLSFTLQPNLDAYASVGRGFETPTLNDLAYRSTNGSLPGLNTGLQPSSSSHYELGLKGDSGRLRADLAAFVIKTHDELAVEQNSGGRSVYENIGDTARRGAELSTEAVLNGALRAHLAYTYLHAVTEQAYTSCFGLPCLPVVIPAGHRIPAVPQNALYANLEWRPRDGHLTLAAETLGRSQIYADDRNTAAAAGYWVTNIRGTLLQDINRWTITETLRIDNLWDRRYVGSVILNDANSRFFEPEPGRGIYLLLTVLHR
jgi:iron complex outermembrane receptor protein